MKPLIVVAGPTAVGKTGLSIRLAKEIGGEIISADSMQVYKHMDIGTAKITEEEKEGVPHFLIDEFEPDEEFNVTVFQQRAKKYMNEIWGRGHIPILVGGTGFYIQAVVYDIEFKVEPDSSSVRKKYEDILSESGKEYLYSLLRERDPEYAADLSVNNTKKVIRALEFYESTGQKLSSHNEEERKKVSPYDVKYFVLTMDREKLYKRIDSRVDMMFNEGLVSEVKWLLDHGYKRDLISMQGLGYKETAGALSGEITMDAAKELIKKGTRHFAKRQLTWFKREKEVIWINKDDFKNDEDIIRYMMGVKTFQIRADVVK